MKAIITLIIVGIVIGIIVTILFFWWAVKQNNK
jgi:nitrogen fixation-related uncharacterized protein